MKINILKKISLWTLGIIIVTIVFLNRGYILANLSPGFRFEKYKTAEEARIALLELHPIGSSIEKLVKTLEKAKAKCGPITTPEYIEKYRNIIFCEYIIPTYILSQYEWKVSIKQQINEKTFTIEEIEVYKHFTAL